MKATCITSHRLPGAEPGKFTEFVAGEEYDLDDPDPVYFRAEEIKEAAPATRGLKTAKSKGDKHHGN